MLYGVTLPLNSEPMQGCQDDALAENVALRNENYKLREENWWLWKQLEEERDSFRLLRISSPLTSVRFGATCGEVSQQSGTGLDEVRKTIGDGSSVAWTHETALPLPTLPDGDEVREARGWRYWTTWCPCCRRPLDVSAFKSAEYWEHHEAAWFDQTLEQDESDGKLDAVNSSTACELQSAPLTAAATATGKSEVAGCSVASTSGARYAYVAVLWGYDTGFVLGALVLGAGLRASGTKHDLVLLHTDDIPQSAVELLSKVWRVRLVDFVYADQKLFNTVGSRFEGVFTKMHVLALTEYAKIVVLDLDIAVLACPDELFKLPAPAALHRRARGNDHGAALNGRTIYVGDNLDSESNCFEWGQSGGINAGVMLLEPNMALYERTMKDLVMPLHPSHISGSGPEQDYLSRILAPWWTHIGAGYNFQLHRTFHALDAVVDSFNYLSWATPELYTERLSLSMDEIKLIHFCGDLKMWDADIASNEDPERFAERLLRDSAGDYYCRLWLDQTAEGSDYEAFGLRKVDGALVHKDPNVGNKAQSLIDDAMNIARSTARMAGRTWWEACYKLPSLFSSLPPLPEILEQVRNPRSVAGAIFPLGARVEYWRRDWFPATVRATHEDETVSVKFDTAGLWGTGARHVKSSRLRPLQDQSDKKHTTSDEIQSSDQSSTTRNQYVYILF